VGRFYLHIYGPNCALEDDEGYELPNAEAAREEAIKSARELMAESLRFGRPMGRNCFFRILDEGGHTVADVPFADAIPPEAGSGSSS
jgi:hypothetical protein